MDVDRWIIGIGVFNLIIQQGRSLNAENWGDRMRLGIWGRSPNAESLGAIALSRSSASLYNPNSPIHALLNNFLWFSSTFARFPKACGSNS